MSGSVVGNAAAQRWGPAVESKPVSVEVETVTIDSTAPATKGTDSAAETGGETNAGEGAGNAASGGAGEGAGSAASGGAGEGAGSAASGGALDIVGSRVREERLRQKIGVRELARRVGVSASLISQVELGKASPSVGTLYAIVNELGLSLDELFFQQSPGRRGPGRTESEAPDSGWRRAEPGRAAGATVADPGHGSDEHWGVEPVIRNIDPVVRRGTGKAIQLATGVRW